MLFLHILFKSKSPNGIPIFIIYISGSGYLYMIKALLNGLDDKEANIEIVIEWRDANNMITSNYKVDDNSKNEYGLGMQKRKKTY